MTHGSQGFGIGAWCWHERHAAPCRVVDREEMWGETSYRVWLPGKDAVVRARSRELGPLDAVRTTVDQILHTAAAAKLLDALEDNLLLAPIQSSATHVNAASRPPSTRTVAASSLRGSAKKASSTVMMQPLV